MYCWASGLCSDYRTWTAGSAWRAVSREEVHEYFSTHWLASLTVAATDRWYKCTYHGETVQCWCLRYSLSRSSEWRWHHTRPSECRRMCRRMSWESGMMTRDSSLLQVFCHCLFHTPSHFWPAFGFGRKWNFRFWSTSNVIWYVAELIDWLISYLVPLLYIPLCFRITLWWRVLWWLCCQGYIDVYVGGQQPNQATSVSSNVLHGEIHVTPSAAGSDRPGKSRVNRMTVEEPDTFNHNSVVKL